MIHRLTKSGFELTREGSFAEFLGIKFVHDKETGAITAMQQGLIKKILVATAMEDYNPNWVPAAPTALGINPVSYVTLSRTVRKTSRRDTSHKLTTAHNFRELLGMD